MKFDTLKENFSVPKAEEQVLEFWKKENIFHKANELAKNRPHYVFYEGPPTANGRPGIHHVIARTVKDLICRYKAMQGFRVDRKGGWDTHGLAVEIEVEKQLGIKTKKEIFDYGIDKFNQKCRESVFKYLEEWNRITERTGYWLDLDDAYVTLTNQYIESVWWILKNFFDRDLIYQGYKTVPFCPRCETGLSSHEVALGYETVKDPSIFIKVKAADGDFSYLVWTTTPWTLPSNAALCLKPDADYVIVEYEGEKLVLAEALVEKVFGTEEVKVLEKQKGRAFEKRKYIPLFDFYLKEHRDKAWYVITGDFVTLEDGTGIVHIAPGFGADDYDIGQKYGLPLLQAIEPNGNFKKLAGPYAGMFIKEADPIITKDLKIAGRLFKKEIYEHSYPFCWRCDSPLIYIARQSWYLKTIQFKEQLLKNNNSINWVPDEIRTGRMLDWLENNVDWSLSRERFWGTPIPIWICDDKKCQKQKAVGSVDELIKEAASDVWQDTRAIGKLDLHKPMMDEVKLKCRCGSSMSRIPEVVDVWFDSGAMPFAQWHYPFEHKDEFKNKYPADFISEGVDQTRGWFYSLLAISTLLFDKAPFKNVIVLEFILDKEGKKMSKHKGNVVDPFVMVDKYGADPLRWYLVSTSHPSLPTRFDEAGLAEVVWKYFDTLKNTYSFFSIYANIDDINDKAVAANQTVAEYLTVKAGPAERFDLWIMSRYNSLVKKVTAEMDKYEILRPVRLLQHFVIEELSNWYVRNNRRRFWAKADDPSKMRAYLTLYQILEGVCRLSAPVAPFISELLWRELTSVDLKLNQQPLSVHLTLFPKPDDAQIDLKLEQTMGLVEKIVSLGRAARSRKNIKIRQPLAQLLVQLPGGNALLNEDVSIVKNELNIKEVKASGDLDQYVSYSAKLNFKAAGPKLGADVKQAAVLLEQVAENQIKKFVSDGTLKLDLGARDITLDSNDVLVLKDEKAGYAVESEAGVTIALTTALTEELIDEGFAREMVNKIQNMRKSSGFEVTDHISIQVHSTDRLKQAATRHVDFIRKETLAQKLEFVDNDKLTGATEWDINGEKTEIALAKVN